MILKLGDVTPVRTLVVVRDKRTVKRYEKCSVQYAVQKDCGIETDGFLVTDENETEIFYSRPNHYEAWD